jgi:hypothetical protein
LEKYKVIPKYIEIETSRYCNRKCEWCPNGTHDVRTTQELMPWSLFNKILTELSHLNYSSWLALHNYNEPLANPRIFQELDAIYNYLPNCSPSIFTNGDLLESKILDKLSKANVNYLRITLYPSNKYFNDQEALIRIYAWLKAKKLEDYAEWKNYKVRQGVAIKACKGKLNLEIISPDINTYNWRGGTISLSLEKLRTDPCYMTHHSASIDYKGNLKMCCNIYPESKEHSSYVIGSLKEESFMNLWLSESMQKYRVNHINADWSNSSICSKCTQYLPLEQVQQVVASLESC